MASASTRRSQRGKTGWVSRLMQEVIPFNRPHRLTVQSLSDERCEVALPFRRRNLNHVGTMHACALATAAEYASGLCVLSAFGVGHVRLVMANMQISYSDAATRVVSPRRSFLPRCCSMFRRS